jgi:hypothetical protein
MDDGQSRREMMRAMRRSHWLLTIVLAGCATQEAAFFTPLNTPPRALRPRPPGTVEVYQYARVVRPMTEVGVIEIRNPDDPERRFYRVNERDRQRLFQQLRAEAGQIGCDGLLMLPEAYRAVCVVYTDADTPAAAKAPLPARPAPAADATSI